MREQVLKGWLSQVFKGTEVSPASLAGDASFRRYYRLVFEGQSYVVMDAPPPEVPRLFADIAEVLAKEGLQVPRVIASNFTDGFLVLSDLGDRLYLPELNDASADRLYTHAMAALLTLQHCQAPLPLFDRAFLHKQMDIFEEWYLRQHKAIAVTSCIRQRLAPIYECLFETIEHQPQVFMHRDYHSRNLMVLDQEAVGILDFQDAMIGPMTYDLVSLLQDCYIAWPREKIVQWVAYFQQQASQQGLVSPAVSLEEFLRWFDWTGVQRHLKNLGIFARLHYRDHKPQYLKDMPQVVRYLMETSSRYEALSPLKAFLGSLPDRTFD